MRKTKIGFIIVSILMLSGCTAEININIDKEFFNQKIVAKIENNTVEEETLFKLIEKNMQEVSSFSEPIYYYEKKEYKKDNFRILEATKNLSIENYEYNDLLDECYSSYKITNNNKKILISTSNEFVCYDKYKILDDVIVQLTTKYKVTNNNADKVNGNTYTWNFTKDNYTNKSIILEVDLTNKKFSILDYAVPISFICVIILVLSVIISVKNKNKKSNQI